ncbi:uncharacterized protein ACLA_094710 [Aspergillus clavatus NRRL 1]|uniref:Uncharacterized protein n=1 Tax=Aspergillus clavatus (strain ATCC 1007 / CBS 513.65 / DSM 816 / NCTC 3887 / NRRL 1 / QM 1276 / 107) TaxID=344612 RepID=A1CFX2_ASPCL|nr:uncharacterized protein ACLA_094710 [Aspergillus clavatus NRRL 1]EAW11771.1 hypothetical protein ACLA_094710 [Aspergillus clavatus NRRL 1]
MKLLAATVSLLTVPVLAGKYAAGTVCNTNTECVDHCLEGRYTIVSHNGGFAFACDPNSADPVQYYVAVSKPGIWKAYAPTATQKTQMACDAMKGAMCNHVCFLSGKKSLEDDMRSQWYDTCRENGDLEPMFAVFSRAEDAKRRMDCKRDIF